MNGITHHFVRRISAFALGSVALAALAAAAPAVGQATLTDLEKASWPTISAGASINGSLDSSDVLRSDGTYADGFVYDGQEGETLTITLRSPDFDSWLVLDDPTSGFEKTDDDSGGGHDARLSVTLPHAGRYMILANVLAKGGTGNYSLTLTSDRQGSGASVASNQAPSEDWARCSDDADKYPVDVQIGGCTALLQSGQLSDDNLAIAYLDRGITFKRQQNYDRAVADFTDSLRLKPNNAKALSLRGSSEFELARYDAAGSDFDAALRIDPKNSIALNGAGRIKMHSNDFAQARDLFAQAISADSTDSGYFANRAVASDFLGDHDQAIADFAQALKIDPKFEFALVNRGHVYQQLHRYSDAAADFDKAVEVNPSAWNHNLACWVRAAHLADELDRAKTECAKAIALDSGNAEILDSRGMLRLKLKQFEAAAADYGAAIRLNPKNASYWYGRAMAERGQGKSAAAAADIAKAKALDPAIAQTFEGYGFKP